MRRFLILLVLLSLTTPTVHAQDPPPDMAAQMEEANRKFDEWIEATNQFIGDVTFDEKSIQSLMEHWDEMEAIGKAKKEEEEDVPANYAEILSDPAYQAFAASNGLAAEPWLKKSMRIISMIMREQMSSGFDQAEAQIPQQQAMIDQQCAQVGEELCKQMKDGISASIAMIERQRTAFNTLPEPTTEEQALLDQYTEELMGKMMAESHPEPTG